MSKKKMLDTEEHFKVEPDMTPQDYVDQLNELYTLATGFADIVEGLHEENDMLTEMLGKSYAELEELKVAKKHQSRFESYWDSDDPDMSLAINRKYGIRLSTVDGISIMDPYKRKEENADPARKERGIDFELIPRKGFQIRIRK